MVVVFLIGREIVCWYFKINEALGLLTQIRDLLAKMPKQTAMAAQARTLNPENLKKYTLCSKCKKRYEGDLGGQFCEQCGSQLREVFSDAVVDHSESPQYCPSCQRADAYHDANGDLYCPNCRKVVTRSF
jgi:Zn finger protein HypA/HybF involved in hydrogenase expression